jgi:hypothetical protein
VLKGGSESLSGGVLNDSGEAEVVHTFSGVTQEDVASPFKSVVSHTLTSAETMHQYLEPRQVLKLLLQLHEVSPDSQRPSGHPMTPWLWQLLRSLQIHQ